MRLAETVSGVTGRLGELFGKGKKKDDRPTGARAAKRIQARETALAEEASNPLNTFADTAKKRGLGSTRYRIEIRDGVPVTILEALDGSKNVGLTHEIVHKGATAEDATPENVFVTGVVIALHIAGRTWIPMTDLSGNPLSSLSERARLETELRNAGARTLPIPGIIEPSAPQTPPPAA